MKQKKRWGGSCFERYAFGILIAIELLMSFTFLGYIHIPPISVTIAYLPILIAGCLFGPLQSVGVGFAFGAASMYKASASYVMPADAIFSPVLSGAPLSSLFLSVGTRTLYGLFIGIAFIFAKKRKHYRLGIGVISAIAPKVHSLIVYTAMGILFPQMGYHYYSAFRWKVNDAVFAAVCVIVVQCMWGLYQSEVVQNIKHGIDQSINNPYGSKKTSVFFILVQFFLLCMAVFAAHYFSRRESYILQQHGVEVSGPISGDMMHLQIQFLIAFLSMTVISVILLILLYKYMSYKEYRGEMDGLTGVMGRRMFLHYCDKAQKTNNAGVRQSGWFLFVDVDYFKSINDTLGHAAGDRVLQEIAFELHNVFGDQGKVGRIGGDEFAVLVEKTMTQQEMEARLEQFLAVISGILDGKKVSCSIGAYQFIFPQNVKALLEETDRVLYQAKENGRACYVVKASAAGTPDGNTKE